MITVSRRNSMAELAGSEASLSSGFDMDLEIDIDTRTAPSRPHLGFEPRSEVPRRPKRGADEFDSLADMVSKLHQRHSWDVGLMHVCGLTDERSLCRPETSST
jgi:hypothetical protein